MYRLRIIWRFKKIFEIFLVGLPIKLNCVFFESYLGRYNDSPRYISEELHKRKPGYNIVWSANISDDGFPSYVKKVRHGSLEYVIYKTLSKVTVDNYVGTMFHYGTRYGNIVEHMIRKKYRLNISTWHGTPLKKIGGNVVIGSDSKGFYSSSNYLIGGCRYTKECLEKATYGKIPVELLGTPRNDMLIKYDESLRKKIKERIGLPFDKKVCLFAPTYRESVEQSGIQQLQMINVKSLLEHLAHIMGGEWIFVFRVHHTVESEINSKELLKGIGNVFNGNTKDDMAEYLYVTDILITDYSGSLFDYALLEKPCVLLTPDRKEYERNPGLYMSMDDLPFPIASTFADLLQFISDINADYSRYRKKVKEFLESIGNVEDGNAANRIAERIIDFIEVSND